MIESSQSVRAKAVARGRLTSSLSNRVVEKLNGDSAVAAVIITQVGKTTLYRMHKKKKDLRCLSTSNSHFLVASAFLPTNLRNNLPK